ncbi:MAG TPA: hypothetical protein VFL97_01645 [Nitrococcus sp.]|nr:hypothetical protein [Nitrococcus sp.]
MRAFTHFNRTLVISLAIFLTLVGLINLAVDPYRVWDFISLRHFNAAKPEADSMEEMFKPIAMTRIKPQVLFLGSSRVVFGLNPASPELSGLGSAYNLGLPGGNLHAIRRNFEHALYNDSHIRMVFLGLDFFTFSTANELPPPSYRDDRLNRHGISPHDAIITLFTMDALLASLQTIISNLRSPDYQGYYPNGMFTAIDMRHQVEREGMPRRARLSLAMYLGKHHLGGFVLSQAAFTELSQIVALAHKHHVRLIVFINPVHAVLLEAIRATGNWNNYLHWRQRLAAITAYWDFSGYNPITTEPIAFTMHYYWDISHYRAPVGDLILHCLLHGPGNGRGTWGVLVHQGDTNARASALESQRNLWIRNNIAVTHWVAVSARTHQVSMPPKEGQVAASIPLKQTSQVTPAAAISSKIR